MYSYAKLSIVCGATHWLTAPCLGTAHSFYFSVSRPPRYRAAHIDVRIRLLLSLCLCVSTVAVDSAPDTLSYMFYRSPKAIFFLSASILDLTHDQVCVVLNNKGVRVCTVCKSPYKASVRLPGGESISLFQSPLPPPYICFMVVTRHQNNEVRQRKFRSLAFFVCFNNFVCTPSLDSSHRVPEPFFLSRPLPLQVPEAVLVSPLL